jgi:CHAT domain-containing protein
LGARLNEDVLLGPRASETELRRYQANGWLSRYRILTFATHGLVNGSFAGTLSQPALALSPPLRARATDDALLTASEAATLNLNADWVILSACNSAAGGSVNGEGLTGLTRAFMLAGARAMLVSHWRVRDDAAERITVRTMELLRDNASYSRGEALQAAMRELMMDASSDLNSSFALPGTWAAFTLVGVD